MAVAVVAAVAASAVAFAAALQSAVPIFSTLLCRRDTTGRFCIPD